MRQERFYKAGKYSMQSMSNALAQFGILEKLGMWDIRIVDQAVLCFYCNKKTPPPYSTRSI